MGSAVARLVDTQVGTGRIGQLRGIKQSSGLEHQDHLKVSVVATGFISIRLSEARYILTTAKLGASSETMICFFFFGQGDQVI